MKFKEKDRVILITDRHGTGHSNPCSDTQFFCAGTVRRISNLSSSLRIVVLWDNGIQNRYSEDDLILYKDEKFEECKSIW